MLIKNVDSLSALKKYSKGHLPLLELRKRMIPLRGEKLGTMSAAAKENPPKTPNPTADLIYLNLANMITAFLSSPEI